MASLHGQGSVAMPWHLLLRWPAPGCQPSSTSQLAPATHDPCYVFSPSRWALSATCFDSRSLFYRYCKFLQASPAWCPLPAMHSSNPHRWQFLTSSLLGSSPFTPRRQANTTKDALENFLPASDFCLLSVLCHCHCWHWCCGSSIGPSCGSLSQNLWHRID